MMSELRGELSDKLPPSQYKICSTSYFCYSSVLISSIGTSIFASYSYGLISIFTSSCSKEWSFYLLISKALSTDLSELMKGLVVCISAVLHFTRRSFPLPFEVHPDLKDYASFGVWTVSEIYFFILLADFMICEIKSSVFFLVFS